MPDRAETGAIPGLWNLLLPKHLATTNFMLTLGPIAKNNQEDGVVWEGTDFFGAKRFGSHTLLA